MSREVHWREAGANRASMSDEEAAERIVSLFLDLIDRTNRGEVDFLDTSEFRKRHDDLGF